ncbi:MAG: hypothetical protein ABIK31_06900 [candidate division WOR-3 bacterium]
MEILNSNQVNYEFNYHLHFSDCFDCVRSKILNFYNKYSNYNIKQKIYVYGADTYDLELLKNNFYPIECYIVSEWDTLKFHNKPTMIIIKDNKEINKALINDLDKIDLFSLLNRECSELKNNITNLYSCGRIYIDDEHLFIFDNYQNIIIRYELNTGIQKDISFIDSVIKYYYVKSNDNLWQQIERIKYNPTKIINFSYNKENKICYILFQIISGYDIIIDDTINDSSYIQLKQSYILGIYEGFELKKIKELNLKNLYILPYSNLYYNDYLLYSGFNLKDDSISDTFYSFIIIDIKSDTKTFLALPINKLDNLIQIGDFKLDKNLLTYYNPFVNYFVYFEITDNQVDLKNKLDINKITNNILLPFIQRELGFIDNYSINNGIMYIFVNYFDTLKGLQPYIISIDLNFYQTHIIRIYLNIIEKIISIRFIDIIDDKIYYLIKTKNNKWYILKYLLEV